ncbi:hypothetical protein [Halapricum desulfuricans]|uniref:Uncharacterized protein n=1 Tax=Halapricum desulfuricans TaxID=2841257 RepID=A0A897N5M7_9EURY|nr:hypothetical protein [Halapricum desulfuricans]QSG06369.1 hypothetical protein HSR121_2037 [Halapricum desulfuricans]
MNLKDRLNDEELEQIKAAEEKSKAEKAAAKRKARRAKTKYGLLLEDEE